MENDMEKENQSSFYKFAFVFVLILGVLFAFRYSGNVSGFDGTSYQAPKVAGVTGNVVSNSGDAQVVKMHVEGNQYILEPSVVRVGIPVRIEADISKMSGCSKGVSIPGFGIQKGLSSSDNVIEFTPDKAGKFNIACSMNMYKGTIEVLSSNGEKSNYVEPSKTSGMSCGSSGGCGCGS